MDINNLKSALTAVGFLAIGSGIAAAYGMISIILINVFAQQVSNGNIPVTSAGNTSIQGVATTVTTAVVTIMGLISLVGGLASLVIVVLALLGKVDFAAAGGLKKSGKNKMF